jgi:hypothetical protein
MSLPPGPPPVLSRGDQAGYLGPLGPNAQGRWPKRGLCRIVSAPHDPDHPAGPWFVIAFAPATSRRAEFPALPSELLPVTE